LANLNPKGFPITRYNLEKLEILVESLLGYQHIVIEYLTR